MRNGYFAIYSKAPNINNLIPSYHRTNLCGRVIKRPPAFQPHQPKRIIMSLLMPISYKSPSQIQSKNSASRSLSQPTQLGRIHLPISASSTWLLLRFLNLQTILGALNPGNVLQTIPAGVVNTFSANTAWQNPFNKTIWIHMADASVALLEDHVWPALIPGSTGTGRSPVREPKLSPHTLPVAAPHQPLERPRVQRGHGRHVGPTGLCEIATYL